MTPLIFDLQQAALDEAVPVSSLLRKALVVATKLGQDDFKKWIDSEQDGYTGDVPEYRRAKGQVMGWNMFTGWQPVQFEDEEIGDLLSRQGTNQSVTVLEVLVSKREGYASFKMPLPVSIQQKLSQGTGFETQYTVITDRASILGILDAIRIIILKWSLALEEAGVIGENMSFTPEESQASGSVAQNISIYAPVIIQNVGQGKAIVVTSGEVDIKKLAAFIDKLAEKIGEIDGLENKEEMEADISIIRAQTRSENPKWDKIRAALRSIGIGLGKAVGSAAASKLLEQLMELL